MILSLGATSPDTAYPFPNFYGIGYGIGGRIAKRPHVAGTPTPGNTQILDIVVLSPAAQRIMDQSERLRKIKQNEE